MARREIVCMTLYRLKKYYTFEGLKIIFIVSQRTAELQYKEGLYAIIRYCENYSFESREIFAYDVEGERKFVIGAVDCTHSQRNRVHPGSKTLYRSDIGRHTISLLISVNLAGSFIQHVSIWNGHNNDNFQLKESKIELEENMFVLGDGGFHDKNVIRTKQPEFSD